MTLAAILVAAAVGSLAWQVLRRFQALAAARRPSVATGAPYAPESAEPLLVAQLADGPRRVALTRLYQLHAAGSPPGKKVPLSALAKENETDALDLRLVEHGLLGPARPLLRRRFAWRLHIALCVVCAFLGTGLYEERGGAAWLNPLSFTALGLFLAGLVLAPRGRLPVAGRRTPAADELLARLGEIHGPVTESSWADKAACGLHADPGGMRVALYGTAGIRDERMRGKVRKSLAGNSSSGCGGGGGGCGGGCGG